MLIFPGDSLAAVPRPWITLGSIVIGRRSDPEVSLAVGRGSLAERHRTRFRPVRRHRALFFCADLAQPAAEDRMQPRERLAESNTAVAFRKFIAESRRSEFSSTPAELARFYELLLNYGTEFLAAEAGVLWRFGETGIYPAAMRGFREAERFPDGARREEHRVFLAATAATGRCQRVEPDEFPPGVEFTNPLDRPVLVAPVAVLGKLVGVLEFVETGIERRAEVEDLPFVTFLRTQLEELLLRAQVAEQSRNEQYAVALNRLSLGVHASLDVKKIAYVAANDLCEQLAADRVGVAIYRRKRCRLAAISGQDRFDSRASVVRILEQLATLAAQTGETIECDETVGDVSPQVKRILYEYLEETHAKQLVVIPLKRKEETKQGPVFHIVGAITVERLAASTPLVGWLPKLERIAPHVGSAVGAGLEAEWPVCESIGGMIRRSPLRRAWRNVKLSTLILAAVVAITLTLVFYPTDFALQAPGKLQPVGRRDVFAEIDGTVRKVLVRHGQDVKQGELLAELVNHDLNVAQAELTKSIQETEQEIANTDRELRDAQRAGPVEQGKITARRATAVERLQGMRAQAAIYQDKQRRLKIYAPIDGRVATWNVEELLMLRPVQQGHLLMSIVDPQGAWELEVRLPEQRLGHVLEAQREKSADLPVTFIIAADPYRNHTATIRDVHLAADVRDAEEGNTVLIKADLADQEVSSLNAGGEVRAKVHCGTKPLGYVWLHDIYEFLQLHVFFRI